MVRIHNETDDVNLTIQEFIDAYSSTDTDTYYVQFIYKLSEMFENVQKQTALRGRYAKDEKGNSLLDRYAITIDEEDFFDEQTEKGSGQLFRKLLAWTKNMFDSYQYNVAHDFEDDAYYYEGEVNAWTNDVPIKDVITDLDGSFADNAVRGMVLTMTSGSFSGESQFIKSSTATTITLVSTFGTSLSGETFTIQAKATTDFTNTARVFDGVDQYTDYGDTGISAKTLTFRMKDDTTTTAMLMNLNATSKIQYDGIIKTEGLTDPTIYVDNEETAAIDDEWRRIIITSETAFELSTFEIGRYGTSFYGPFSMHDVRAYDRVITADERASIQEFGVLGDEAFWDYMEGDNTVEGFDVSEGMNDGTHYNLDSGSFEADGDVSLYNLYGYAGEVTVPSLQFFITMPDTPYLDLFEIVENKLEEALELFVIKEWYRLNRFVEEYQIEDARYNDLAKEIKGLLMMKSEPTRRRVGFWKSF